MPDNRPEHPPRPAPAPDRPARIEGRPAFDLDGPRLSARTRRQLQAILHAGTPAHTRRALESDLNYFWAWARRALPGEDPRHDSDPALWQEHYPVEVATVLQFITDHTAGLKEGVDRRLLEDGVKRTPGAHAVATVARRISTLSKVHDFLQVANPCRHPLVRELLARARRDPRQKPRRIRAALTRPHLVAVLATCDDSLAGLRDQALLLFGVATGGRRRSEISEAQVEHLEAVGDDYRLHLPRQKTDQEGRGMTTAVVGDAAQALRAWLTAGGIHEGPIFRRVNRHGQVGAPRPNARGVPVGLSPESINSMLKRRCAEAGLNPAHFSAHSLRKGFVTESGEQGHAVTTAMAVSGHRDVNTAAAYHAAGAVPGSAIVRLCEGTLGEAHERRRRHPR